MQCLIDDLESAHMMVQYPNMIWSVCSVLILIPEWAHLMVKCPNIDFGMGSPDDSVS